MISLDKTIIQEICFFQHIRGDTARVFQTVYMNLNMTVGQVACQLLCRYTQSTLAASFVC